MKQRRALLLSCFMLRGYGVSVVAEELQKRLSRDGWDLHIGYLDSDSDGGEFRRVYMPADAQEVLAYCARERIDVVIAQTSPYFEILPELAGEVATVCFEHGDPTPEFFTAEAASRAEVKEHKIREVYPKVSDVWTISHFLRHDIGWLSAKVTPNGADHVGVVHADRTARTGPVKVGFLARLGALEAEYKGNDLLIELARRFAGDDRIEFVVMGRGTAADARAFEQAGMSVALNATDEERARFFGDIDVFFTASRWEGFNLPLVEAQHSGCAAMAFDVGAHPETTPYVVGSLGEAEVLIRHWIEDRDALAAAARRCQRFVDERFTWEASAQRFAQLLEDVSEGAATGPAIVRRVRSVIRRDGIGGLVRKVLRRLRRR
jgi:glycosyltransferase involved in cell wall biosynthesis